MLEENDEIGETYVLVRVYLKLNITRLGSDTTNNVSQMHSVNQVVD